LCVDEQLFLAALAHTHYTHSNKMLKRRCVYSPEQITLLWNHVAFNDCRRYAFFNGTYWMHPEQHFNKKEFEEFLVYNKITDVHVKALENNGGREWVIDVDFDKNDPFLTQKIDVAVNIFKKFFGNNIARIMHSGNRGIHVWLKIDKFLMHATKEKRQCYYKVFEPPKRIEPNKIHSGSFIHAVQQAVEDPNDILRFWPLVDKHVFCNLGQIRAPFSYNYKGRNFSQLIYPEDVILH
jgi:hypothetical protein